jgi:hypothetical protein
MSVQLDGSVVIHVPHAGTFILNASMKSVSSFHMPVAIQLTWVLTWAYSPSGYLPSHHYLLFNLSLLGHPLLTVEMVLFGNKSMSQTG